MGYQDLQTYRDQDTSHSERIILVADCRPITGNGMGSLPCLLGD